MKKILVIVLVLFLAGCVSTQKMAIKPMLATSEYFQTTAAGLIFSEKERGAEYVLLLKQVKPLSNTAHFEIFFENPRAKDMPISEARIIGPSSSLLSLSSPMISGFRRNHNYSATVKIYSDSSKKELLGTHVQLIRANKSY